ncbi:tRNA (N(6)-L-threonylcarbamoyladenosine(37)-C(2))-methylthiotransferase MtaB [Patescibacteria group bacterium]|nr:tRNA (N(6)-L-threonylcarbamoyladenosine(37)-C(2))-methylthiotransferase MtaB [Patescibacteria group bacterium]MBU1613284.1 tRNA (N(6)-L-threonylcarbamoyladenosine(37)-C(2))-methylthiotransferase MtaB [Patescibacteria group bacterium]
MKISFHTFGCKLNQAETEDLKNELVEAGHFVVPIESGEDIAVVRGCAVTMGASRSTREMIRRLKRSGAYVVVLGCLENNGLPEIDFVAKDNEEVAEHLEALCINLSGKFGPLSVGLPRRFAPRNDRVKLGVGLLPAKGWQALLSRRNDRVNRTRAFVKIQTGCNFNCAYCVIPSFRGKSKSVPVDEILKKIYKMERDGFKEAVLTGVNICQYCDKTPSSSPFKRGRSLMITELLRNILQKTKIPRIRLGSLDPRLISGDLIKIFLDNPNRLLPHWHLSLQSASNDTLKQMGRHYTAQKYREIVNELRAVNPLFSVTTDIIVGFPGETEQDFETTCDFAREMQFSKVHVFPYSKRANTPAEKMSDQIQDKIKTERAKKLIIIADGVAKKYARQLIGQVRPILFEKKSHSNAGRNVWLGYTPEYVRIKYQSDENLENVIKKVIIDERMLNGK